MKSLNQHFRPAMESAVRLTDVLAVFDKETR